MVFLKYKNTIINLERITQIYKERFAYKEIRDPKVVFYYNIVLAGDGQEIKIRFDSEEKANKTLDKIEKIVEECCGLYRYTEISNDNKG